jgi:hypothetical protein
MKIDPRFTYAQSRDTLKALVSAFFIGWAVATIIVSCALIFHIRISAALCVLSTASLVAPWVLRQTINHFYRMEEK